ncbi:MAG: LrgB family protein [Eubacteriales bacterium]|nr:LrgB family protein [Eubacteriales bacterium]
METIWSNMLFGIILTILTYQAGIWINQKVKSPLANPLLLSIIFCVIIMKLLHISYDDYMEGGRVINMLIGPATAVIGLSVFRQRKVLQKEFVPIIAGSLGACICSMGSVWILGNLLGLDKTMTVSMFPKSVTTAIALDVSVQLNGMKAITLMAVIMTGVLGSVICPALVRLLHLKDPVATGVAMGSTSHAAGTARAMEMGEIQGAVSGVCIGVAGLLTALIAVFL